MNLFRTFIKTKNYSKFFLCYLISERFPDTLFMYRNLRDVHDNMLKELCKKELHINYLLKDMNSVKLKIDAYHQTLNEKELRVKELADKSWFNFRKL